MELTPASGRRSVTRMLKQNATRAHARSWEAVAISLLLLLALLVAPICGQLCTTQACSRLSSTGTEAQCHFTPGSGGGSVHLHAVRNCGAPDLQMANLASSFKPGTLQALRSVSSARSDYVPSMELSNGLKAYHRACNGCCTDSPPLGPSTLPATTTVLRI